MSHLPLDFQIVPSDRLAYSAGPEGWAGWWERAVTLPQEDSPSSLAKFPSEGMPVFWTV